MSEEGGRKRRKERKAKALEAREGFLTVVPNIGEWKKRRLGARQLTLSGHAWIPRQEDNDRQGFSSLSSPRPNNGILRVSTLVLLTFGPGVPGFVFVCKASPFFPETLICLLLLYITSLSEL